ncbi:hypothetical protein EON66_11950 [archaeon]|nr:MAG: hypothetical protein EON66_11950 [archaeon]
MKDIFGQGNARLIGRMNAAQNLTYSMISMVVSRSASLGWQVIRSSWDAQGGVGVPSPPVTCACGTDALGVALGL